jgi:PHD/YefM family antitoxin component YafN of YafNO toxin-antitoxin module
MYRTSLGNHECFCNFCGDDIEKKSQDIAQSNFEVFKTEFQKKQQPVVSSENNDKNQIIMGELKDKYEVDFNQMKKQLTIQNEVNTNLMEKI